MPLPVMRGVHRVGADRRYALMEHEVLQLLLA